MQICKIGVLEVHVSTPRLRLGTEVIEGECQTWQYLEQACVITETIWQSGGRAGTGRNIFGTSANAQEVCRAGLTYRAGLALTMEAEPPTLFFSAR
jgi:hypothetical protein